MRGGTPWIGYFRNGEEIRESAGQAIAQAVAKKHRCLTEDEARVVAQKFLEARVRQVRNERDAIRPFLGPAQERVKVNELLDDLVAVYERGGKRGSPRKVSPPMRSHIERLREYFGKVCALAVTQRAVLDFCDLLKSQGKQNGTVNRSLQLLSQAFNIAASSDPPKVLRPLTITKLDESENVRTGKFTEREAQLVFSSLPPYMADVACFAYETGARVAEILKLRWTYVDGDLIRVPGKNTKNRKPRIIALTPELKEILTRRRAARVEGCELIFHHDGRPIVDYRKSWQSACLVSGLGHLYCRDCRDDAGQYISVLDAIRKCPTCGRKCMRPKYIGRIFHDFRRTAAHDMWKAGSTIQECMEVTGHKTEAMFKRYADLFSDEEKRNLQREVQRRRHERRQAEEQGRLSKPAGTGEASQETASGRVQ